jgi:hypothetical protein
MHSIEISGKNRIEKKHWNMPVLSIIACGMLEDELIHVLSKWVTVIVNLLRLGLHSTG